MRRLGALTQRQHAVLAAIAQHLEATGEVPSLSYLARRFSLDWTTVREHVAALYRKGWLRTPSPGPPAPHRPDTP
jgi:DNA-binding MarR family transcriptional regulator